ncbi:hypothetical protein C8F01DRAFT_1332885 [Mycena amicta]|nr:hypothetical protein C8F01DRAFT_1332885 [Mycena amicta]
MSHTSDSAQFDAAADFTAAEVTEYRRVMFPAALGDPAHTPFFSIEDAPLWVTARGYSLYQEFDPAERLEPLRTLTNATLRQLRSYREQVVGSTYINDPFFRIDQAQDWVAPGPFNTWMQLMDDHEQGRSLVRGERGTMRSHTPASEFSAGTSPPRSRTMSRARRSSGVSSAPLSRSPSAASAHGSSYSHRSYGAGSAPSSRAASPYPYPVPAFDPDSDARSFHQELVSPPLPLAAPSPGPAAPVPAAKSKAPRRKGKGKAKEPEAETRIKITRELYVDRMIPVTTAPPTWTVPRDKAAYKLDVSANPAVLTKNGKARTIDAYIKAEDQDAWDGSTGHIKGDVWVHAFSGEKVRARRAQLRCRGVCMCEFASEELFGDCERFEPDVGAMQDLWNHELDANDREAASPEAILSRFYTRVITTKCKKVGCDGVPIFKLLSSGPNQYGKLYFIGCSKWCEAERWLHRYHPIPSNVDEDVFKSILENNGRLPDGAQLNVNAQCVLTAHPRLGLKHCSFSHILNGVIQAARLLERKCDTECLIFVPVRPPADTNHPDYYEWLPEYAFQAILVFRIGHNHPEHPHSKPSAADEHLLEAAMDALGGENLTVQTLLNGKCTVSRVKYMLNIRLAQSTSTIYGGKQVSAASPAFTDVRKIRDRIAEHRKVEFPEGTGFKGVQHYMQTVERSRPVSERYIHAAMSKGDFNLVVTFHPLLAKFIHGVFALAIDFTFKRVEGEMDEWEVVGFSERFKTRVPFASFYCDKKTTAAFQQLFVEEKDSIEYVLYCLKTCVVHFQRNVDELHRLHQVPLPVVTKLKTILGARDQAAVDEWHHYCAAQTHSAVQNWYSNKIDKPWYLPSINPFLSKIARDDYNLTPNTTNLAESAHAGTNAQTSTQLALLPGILRKYTRDNAQADELHRMMRSGIMRKHWNGPAQRERRAEQRKGWAAKATFQRNEHLIAFDELTEEREEGQAEWKFSLGRQKAIEGEIEELQLQLKKDRRREDLRTEVKVLRLEVDAEKQARRDWVARRGEIDAELRELRAGPLKGVPIQRARRLDNDPAKDPEQVAKPAAAADTVDGEETEMGVQLSLANDVEDVPMDWTSGVQLDPELEPNYEVLQGGIEFIDDDDIFSALPSPTSDLTGPQQLTAGPAFPLPSTPTPPAPPAPAPAIRRRRLSVDEVNIVEGTRDRRRSKRARGESDVLE